MQGNVQDSPSPFITAWIARIARELPPGSAALDVAMGAGRHAVALAEAGFVTFGIDRDLDRLRIASERARNQGLTLRVWAADLTCSPLPSRRFDLVVASRYLQRDLFEALRDAVRPDGFVLYETFTTLQLKHPTGPRCPEHLLRPGELRQAFCGWRILSYEEREQPEAVAELAARKGQ